MSVTTTPHLNFRGEAKAALEFYHSVFGGSLVVVTNEEAYSVERPEEAGQVKFGQVLGGSGFAVMAYDVPSSVPYDQGDKSFFVSVRGDSAEEITDLWNRLVEGSTVLQDLAPSAFSPAYGMVQDRFGVVWVLDVAVAYAPAG
ncbi:MULTISPECIES: VOC family protein [unclassified Arthrobacter]|uniref:VOC family protein n=1 Tax=unclassified Arthrobacter TaxID=235627 RepID=UPI001E3E7CAF|nr:MULTISPECIES: VOC family protein [unclassified Arthrobacter]MCC9145608.1 VOC family protein [Arthrobacter sp. zg-Y919]MDK1276837.1 VOC family protein [Arthrobacter sp. zg.Y919]WIB04225.1 VOC family protein [Arthrobacter sp. zg-Y919]